MIALIICKQTTLLKSFSVYKHRTNTVFAIVTLITEISSSLTAPGKDSVIQNDNLLAEYEYASQHCETTSDHLQTIYVTIHSLKSPQTNTVMPL